MSSPSNSSRKQTMSGTSPNSNRTHPSPSSSSSTPSSNLFPVKLHRLLAWTEEKEKYSHIIYWMPDGKSFRIADKEGLIAHVLPATEWFGGNGSPQIQSYKSFHRNLNLWEFKTASKTTVGIPRGAIYHPLFQKGRMDLVQGMTRINKRLNPQRKFVRKTASPSASPLKQHVRSLPPKSILATSSSSSHLLRSPTVPLQAEDILQRGRTRGISTSSGSTVSTAALSPSPALHTTPTTTSATMAAPTIAEEVASAVVSIDNNHQRTSSSSLENTTTTTSSRGDTIPHVMFLEAGAAQVLGSLRGISSAGKEEEDHD